MVIIMPDGVEIVLVIVWPVVAWVTVAPGLAEEADEATAAALEVVPGMTV